MPARRNRAPAPPMATLGTISCTTAAAEDSGHSHDLVHALLMVMLNVQQLWLVVVLLLLNVQNNNNLVTKNN